MKYLMFSFLLFWATNSVAQIGDVNYLSYALIGNQITTDLDNDGDLDIVLSNLMLHENDRSLVWYENVEGIFESYEPHNIFLDYDGVQGLNGLWIDVADVNGDGWKDIIVGKTYTLLHNGNSDDVDFTVIDNQMTSSNPIITGDLNNDGYTDIIRQFSGGYSIYMNENHDGTFPNSTLLNNPYPTTSTLFSQQELYDLDSDGDLDLVEVVTLQEEEKYELVYYPNNGDGTFGDIVYLQEKTITVDNIAASMRIGQANSDTIPDVVISTKYEINLHTQQADASWNFTQIAETEEFHLTRFGDLDGDDDLDLVASRRGLIRWYHNIDGEGTYELADSSINSYLFDIFNTEYLEVFDFNEDGKDDFVIKPTASSANVGPQIFLNDLESSNTFLPLEGGAIEDFLTGNFVTFPTDLDVDGDNDIVFHALGDDAFYYLENLDGLGNFSEVQTFDLEDVVELTHVADLNSDGLDDILAVNEAEELFWLQNQSTSSNIQFSAKQVLANEVQKSSIATTDFDQDGDLDIGIANTTDNSIYWLEQESPESFLPHLVFQGSEAYSIFDFADLNNDNRLDILYSEAGFGIDNNLYVLTQNEDQSFSSTVLREGLIAYLEVIDIDNDLDDDIFIRAALPVYGVHIYQNTPSGLTDFLIEEIDPNNNFYFDIADVDGDGNKDIITDEGWYKQLNAPDNFSEVLSLFNFVSSPPINTGDLDGDGIVDFITNYTTADALAWASNEIAELSVIQGQVAIDENLNCTVDEAIDTVGFYDVIISFQKDSVTSYYTNTNSQGFYYSLLPESGDYTVNANFPTNYWLNCVVDTLVMDVNPDTPTLLDFPVQGLFDCPLVTTEISSTNLRPCIQGYTLIEYCNEGTIPAEDATVEVLIDSLLMIDSTDTPYVLTDSSYLFEIGTLGILECGSIKMWVTPDCDSIEVGDVVCLNAIVTPDSLCGPVGSIWDGSTITATGFCQGDSAFFELKNIGMGAMDELRQFRVEIVNEDIVLMILVDTFQLEPGATKMIALDAEMEAIRIEADQDEDHPNLIAASTIVTGCAMENISFDLFPFFNDDPFNTHFCQEITGSYDPNIKEAAPAGYGLPNYIDRSWELDYTIHFQNTGNDTAFTVVVKDPISEFLDLSSLRMGTGSHPFNWELNAQREITFTFNNILLPDSTTNEVESHGFVNFSIKPDVNVPFETLIENRAAIYFDFNEPIITDVVSRTIRTPIIATSQHLEVCELDFVQDVQVFEDVLIVDSTLTAEGLHLDFYHVHVLPVSITNVDTMMPFGTVFNGVLIEQDTIVDVILQNTIGCDSIIQNNISVITDTDELENSFGLKIYPTPTTGIVQISWNGSYTASKLSLLGMNGQSLRELKLGENNYELHLENLPQGMYWIRIEIEGELIHRKVIKIEK